jgi:Holliday junction resolvasome RuvABC endonuclease subunit
VRRVYIGIDPGKSGSIAAIVEHGESQYIHWLKNAETEQDLSQWVWQLLGDKPEDHFAYIENVHSTPQMGVTSAFTFGDSLGFLRGLLTAHQIPFEKVTPQKWQKVMGCLSKSDKNVTKAAAQRLFPREKITHANADALLLAEYCRRVRTGNGNG